MSIPVKTPNTLSLIASARACSRRESSGDEGNCGARGGDWGDSSGKAIHRNILFAVLFVNPLLFEASEILIYNRFADLIYQIG